MATNYKIRLKRFNGTDYDTLNLVSDNIIMSSGNDLQTDFNGLDSAIDDIVYVGDTAPTDPDVKIWLDTDASGVSAVNSVNGKAGTVVLNAEDVGAMSEWDLLWENASPTSSFGAQTISLDLSGYSLVAVFIRNTTGSDSQYRAIDLVPIGAIFADKLITMSGTNVSFFSRVFTTTQNGITCSEASRSTQGSSPTIDNTRAFPYKIWGIKGVTT